MSRTTIQLKCDDPQESERVIQQVLKSYNYELKEKNGEEFYQNGVGFFVAPKFIKYTFDGDILTLEGWVKAFAFGGESNLDGFLAAVPKKSCKKTLDDIQFNLSGQSSNLGEVVTTAEEKSHNLALVLGIIFALFIPIIGIIFGIYLMTRSDSEKSKMYGAIVIVLAVISWLISFIFLMR